MRTIILIQHRAERGGIALTVVPPPGPLIELLNVAGLRGRIDLVGDEQLAAPAGFVERIELELPSDPSAPARARAEVRESIRATCAELDLSTALLLTSELVTNAVIHPRAEDTPSIGLRIFKYDDRIRIEVSDRGAGFDPANPPATDDPTGGRGLLVVDHGASRWGTAPRGFGEDERFTAWFELETLGTRSGEDALSSSAGRVADRRVRAALD